MPWREKSTKVETVEDSVPDWKKRATKVEDDEDYEPSWGTVAIHTLDSIPIAGKAVRGIYEPIQSMVTGVHRDKIEADTEEQLAEYRKKRPGQAGALGFVANLPLALIPGGAISRITAGATVAGADSLSRGESIGGAAKDAGLVGAVDTVAELVGKGLGGIYRAGKGAIRRNAFKVPDDIATRYGARRKAINAIDSEESIANAERFQKKLKDDYDLAQLEKSDALNKKKLYDDQIKAEMRKASPDMEVVRSLVSDMKATRSEISRMSGDVFDTLAKDPSRRFPKEPLRRALIGHMDKLRIGGEIDPRDASAFSFYKDKALRTIEEPSPEELMALTNKLSKAAETGLEPKLSKRDLDIIALNSGAVTNDLSPVDMKNLLMKLDDATDSVYDKFSKGERPTLGDRQLVKFSKDVRRELESIPEYAEQMKPLREKTQILSELSDFVSADEAEAFKFLNSLRSPEKQAAREALDRFGKERGRNYLKQISEAERLRNIRESPIEMHEYLQSQPQARVARDREIKAIEAKNRLEDAGGRFSIRAAYRSARNPDFTQKEKLDRLGMIMNKDLAEEARDVAVKDFFARKYNPTAQSRESLFDMVPGANAAKRAVGSFPDQRELYKTISDLKASRVPKFAIDALIKLLRTSPKAFMIEANRIMGRETEE